MSPRDAKGHGSNDKDPKLAKIAKIIREAPFPPTAPKDSEKHAKAAARLARKLLGKRGGKS